jgi:hypothetical protein
MEYENHKESAWKRVVLKIVVGLNTKFEPDQSTGGKTILRV